MSRRDFLLSEERRAARHCPELQAYRRDFRPAGTVIRRFLRRGTTCRARRSTLAINRTTIVALVPACQASTQEPAASTFFSKMLTMRILAGVAICLAFCSAPQAQNRKAGTDRFAPISLRSAASPTSILDHPLITTRYSWCGRRLTERRPSQEFCLRRSLMLGAR